MDYYSGKGGRGIRLFGVDISLQNELLYSTSSKFTMKNKKRIHKDVECIRSKSTGNLPELCDRQEHHQKLAHDDPDHLLHLHSRKPVPVRNKGIPWTPSEHRYFLHGLEILGKGDWKGISKNYVPTRTPTQVASHAQKYFIRITAADKKNRRASLFDIPYEEFINSPPYASPAASSNASEGSQQAGVLEQSLPAHANFPAQGLFLQPHRITYRTAKARPATTLAENSGICEPFVKQYQIVKGPTTSTVATKHGLEASIGALSL